MSDHDLVAQQQQSNQQPLVRKPIIDFYQSTIVNQSKIQQKLKTFYNPLDFPLCGDLPKPNINPIKDKKKSLNIPFAEDYEQQNSLKLSVFDGHFQHKHSQQQTEGSIIRFKSRMIRDLREQFFQENGQFVLQEQFYQQQMSRLANISFQQNLSIKTFQKNAILSQRNNQKKNNPFQLNINIGYIEFRQHTQKNEEQIKFEQILPLMKQFSQYCLYPKLPQLSKQLDYLDKLRQDLLQSRVPQQQLTEINDKIKDIKRKHQKEKNKLEEKLNKIIQGWTQIKAIRTKNGMQTVPYQFKVKQYQLDGKKSYDIGVNQIELPQKVISKSTTDSQNQQKRRQRIKSQRYAVKIYVNDFQVARSQKVNLQWPLYKVNFNQKFSVMVYSIPNSIRVQILKIGIINQVIDTVSLSIPGNNAKTITSTQKRYQYCNFAINGNKVRKGIQKSQSPSGIVVYKIQWKGQGNKMPPISSVAKINEQQTAATEEDIQQMTSLYDQNDPRKPHKKKRQIFDKQIIRQQNSLLPFAKIQSTRHFLLKLKSLNNQYEHIKVPLLEEQIKNRQDLQQILTKERNRNLQIQNQRQTQYYHPLQGVFRNQALPILEKIKTLLNKIEEFKKINRLQLPSLKHKVVEQVIKQFIFENQISPLVLFFKDLFTQKRKLGPKNHLTIQPKGTIEAFQINIHIKSAKNVPIRQSAYQGIRKFQEEQNRRNQMHRMIAGNVQMMNQFGMGFWNNQPNMNPGMGFGGGMMPNRPQQVDYDEKNILRRVESSIELRFKKHFKKTHSFQGPYPQWNETLMFSYDFKKQNTNLQKITQNTEKVISLFLFDMIQQSKPTYAMDQIRVKKSKYYLGKIQIPFSTIVVTPSVTGIFKIDRPLMIFSYGIKKANLFDQQNDEQQANRTQFPDIHTYLNLDFFSQPLVDSGIIYSSDRKFILGKQDTLILQKATEWLEDLNTKRYVRMWLNNVDNKSILICRYLSDQIAPPRQLGTQKLIERCARFVSLIPKKFQCKFLENTDQFHLMCDQFLNIKMGEDHGILLCNYFNYIDNSANRQHIQSYLIIGKSFPYGKSIFVLRRDKKTNNCQIWDPFKGQSYFFPAKEYDTYCFCIKLQRKVQTNENFRDICPMFEVGCIVAKDNIYVNNQVYSKPTELDFNLQDENLWKAFLNERTRKEVFVDGLIQSCQPQIKYEFYPQPQNLQMGIQSELHEYIRNKIETQRRRQFNPYGFRMNNSISRSIRERILLHCQTFKNDYRLTGINSTLYDNNQRSTWQRAVEVLVEQKNSIMADVDSQKNLYGFPLNFTFTTKQQIWQKIAETQIHLNQKQDIEFVLSVRCFQVVCHIVSVWVFIGFIE